jgi:hypothetical protein
MTIPHRRLAWCLSVAAVWIAVSGTALACPVCFRIEEGPVADGVRAAVFVLIGVTTTVLSGVAMFLVRFIRRSAQQAETS